MSRARQWRVALGAWLAIAPTTACAQEARGASSDPTTLYRTGHYPEAVTAARAAIAAGDSAAATILVRALAEQGQWREAIAAGAPHLNGSRGPRVALALGSVHRAIGDLAQAEAMFTRARRGRDSLMAEYELAQLAFDRGEHAAALDRFDRFIDRYNDTPRSALSGSDLRAVGLAVRMLGRRDPQLFKDALKALDQANAADTVELDGRLEVAALLLEKFNYAEARKALGQLLAINPRHPRALLVLARLDAAEGRSTGPTLVEKSLEVNPHAPEAHAMAAMQLVDVERYDDATAAARKGLAVDSGSPAPWIAIAAARLLAGDRAGYEAALQRAHQRLPGSAVAEVTLADVLARNRLYREAATVAAAGVARDSLSARALALLGINQMRIGEVAQGQQRLTRAFALDPYDVWVKNTLDLLDTFTQYTELRSDRFVILAETKDAPLLELFVPALAEQAYDALAARYGFRPPPPVRVELFRSSADFSVRSVGLGGLGALGVSFGPVVAMDSPAARPVGQFNWGSTLWHEITHTFTLGATGNRVPRWISEGLSVYEERRARPSWGADLDPALVAAWKAKQLHPVSQLNNGFLRPRNPEEVGLSYALASYVCEMIEAEYGIAGIRGLLAAFRDGKDANAAFASVAGMPITAFDDAFDRWFRARFAKEFRAVEQVVSGEGSERTVRWEGPLFAAMRAGATAVAAKQWNEAVPLLEGARTLFPSWADEGSPYHLLAEVHLARGDTAAAARELAAIAERNESAFTENVRLARLLRARGDLPGAIAALERTLFITPFDGAVHDSLAVLATAARAHPVAIRSRRALVALRPTDRAEALYQLARAYADAGDVPSARREVLRALDLAPNFEKAQELLLTLRAPEGSR